jgi:hypothetical protein
MPVVSNNKRDGGVNEDIDDVGEPDIDFFVDKSPLLFINLLRLREIKDYKIKLSELLEDILLLELVKINLEMFQLYLK